MSDIDGPGKDPLGQAGKCQFDEVIRYINTPKCNLMGCMKIIFKIVFVYKNNIGYPFYFPPC